LRLLRRIHRALRKDGVLVIADCYLSSDSHLRVSDRAFWLAHLERRYTPAQARGYLRAWAKEDYYARLADETRMLERAGFGVDIAWRLGSFAVVVAGK